MIGTGELIVILVLVLMLFGGKKLPEFARNLGKGLREFKKGAAGIEDDEFSKEREEVENKRISRSKEDL